MQSKEMLAAEEMQQVLPKNSFVPNPWTAKAKKNTVVTFEVEGKKTSLPIQAYLKQQSMSLPPMKQNGKRVVHFNELWWRFMHGKTKEESQKAVDEYCADMVHIWNEAVKARIREENQGLMFEDELPEMTEEQYSEWYAKSQIIDGVRMGPIIEKTESDEDHH